MVLSRCRIAAALAFALMAVVVLPSPRAGAAYPGTTGRIVFTSYDDGRAAIYTAAPDGTQRKRLSSAFYNAQPSWSPNGRRIVYLASNGNIWTMRADGTDKQRVTAKADFQRRNPVFSPDGRRIMWGTYTESGRGVLFSIKVNGTGKRRIGRDIRGDMTQAVFSPAGGRIAFEYWKPGATDLYASGIYTLRLDGTGLRKVTGPWNWDRQPDWSPDGKHLVFYRHVENRSVDVHRVRADGSGRQRLTRFSKANAKDPVWSPDGTRIAFIRETFADNQVWSMKADGSDKRVVVDSAGSEYHPDWQAR